MSELYLGKWSDGSVLVLREDGYLYWDDESKYVFLPDQMYGPVIEGWKAWFVWYEEWL